MYYTGLLTINDYYYHNYRVLGKDIEIEDTDAHSFDYGCVNCAAHYR